MLGAVEWGIYLYISMGTTTIIMLLFTRLLRIRRAMPSFSKKSPFWSVNTERQPWSFQTKTGSASFSKVSVFQGGKCSLINIV